MKGSTVTMPLEEYDHLMITIRKLHEQNISTCITKEFTSLKNNTYTIDVDEKLLVELISNVVEEKFKTNKWRLINKVNIF